MSGVLREVSLKGVRWSQNKPAAQAADADPIR